MTLFSTIGVLVLLFATLVTEDKPHWPDKG